MSQQARNLIVRFRANKFPHTKMSKIKSDSLHHAAWIMGSDDDQPIIQEIYVGFDSRDNLIVSIDNIDYEDHRYDCSTWVTVEKEEVQALAKRLKVKFSRLPIFISESMEEWREIINANFKQVQSCFKDITECLLDEGCRFRIDRTFGPHDWMCC